MTMTAAKSPRDTSVPLVSPTEVSRALRTAILYIIVDAFDLTEQEEEIVLAQLVEILRPVERQMPRAIPLPVKRELEEGLYTRMLAARRSNGYVPKPRAVDGSTLQASVQDWSQVMADMVTQTYELRPLVDASIIGAFTGILLELGVGIKGLQRASKYLPTAVRHKLNEN